MKPRKVMVHLELKSNLPLIMLKDKHDWNTCMVRLGFKTKVHQVSVHVVKEAK